MPPPPSPPPDSKAHSPDRPTAAAPRRQPAPPTAPPAAALEGEASPAPAGVWATELPFDCFFLGAGGADVRGFTSNRPLGSRTLSAECTASSYAEASAVPTLVATTPVETLTRLLLSAVMLSV